MALTSLMRTLVAFVALVPLACTDAELENFGRLGVRVDGQVRQSWLFHEDQTRGQLKQQARVDVSNTGDNGLRLGSIVLKTANPYITMRYRALSPTFPLELPVADALTLDVRYHPDPNIVDRRGARLEIDHDDDLATQPMVVEFAITGQPRRLCRDTTSLQFTNPSKHAKSQACATFRSCGSAPLTFEDAFISTSTPHYVVVKAPEKGEAFDPGTTFDVCVRVQPAGKDADYAADLVIKTNDSADPTAKVTLSVDWQPAAFEILLPDDSDTLELQPVSATPMCFGIRNTSKAGWLLQALRVVAIEPLEQAAAEARYTVTARKPDATSIQPPFAASKGKQLQICAAIADSSVPAVPAYIEVDYTQVNESGNLNIPLTASCTSGGLVNPAPINTVQVQGGGQIGLAIANQDCGTATFLKACATTLPAPKGSVDPCASGPTGELQFGLDALTKIGGFDVLPFVVGTSADATGKRFAHLLFCPGPLTNKACPSGVRRHTFSVQITKQQLAAAPKWAWDEPPKRLHGAILRVVDEHPNVLAFRWQVLKRPAKSRLWFAQQFSLAPYIKLVPDAAGAYEIQVSRQSWADASKSTARWSAPTLVTFTVN